MSKRRQNLKELEYQRQRQRRTQLFGIGLVVVVGLAALIFFVLRVRPGTSAAGPGTSDGTAQAVDAYLQWPVVVADAFDDEAHGWQYGPLTDAIADANLSVRDGRYHWELLPRHSVLWQSSADP